MYVSLFTSSHVYVCVRTRACVCVRACVRACVYVRLYVCV